MEFGEENTADDEFEEVKIIGLYLATCNVCVIYHLGAHQWEKPNLDSQSVIKLQSKKDTPAATTMFLLRLA